MAMPWEEYQQAKVATPAPAVAAPAAAAGPWDDYQQLPGDSSLPITDLPTVTAQRPDFSGVTSSVDSTALDNAGDGWKYGIPRDIAFGARSVLQGTGSLFGALGGDAINGAVINPLARLVGAPESRSYRDESIALADVLGLPKAQNARERVMNDVGEAISGTALTLGAGSLLSGGARLLPNVSRAAPAPQVMPTVAQRAGEFLSAQPVLQGVSAATGAAASGATREAGGGPGAQILAALAGGLTPAAVTAGAPAVVRGAVRGGEAGRQALQQAIDDFSMLGTTPSVGQGTGRWSAQGAESLLSGGPTSGGVMRRFAEQQNEEIGEGLGELSNSLAKNISGERAGRAIDRGVDTFAKNTGAMRKALYWQADQHIPSATPIGVSNTQRTLTELTTPIAGAEATTGAQINPKIQQMANNLAEDVAAAQQAGSNGIPYEAVKRIRSQIGEELSDFSLSTDRPTAQLKKLYASLSQDLEAAAQAQGPRALAAVKRANNYFKASAERLETLERVVDKNGGPEKVFQAAMAGTKDGATTLRAVMRSLPVDSQKAVSAAVIKRMGLATPSAQNVAGDAFSPNTFLTRWGNLSPEARRTLFGRFGNEFSENMDKVARVAERIKLGSEVFKNPSGTANRGAALAYGASLATAIMSGSPVMVGGLAASGGASNLAARLMTNPHWVKWLAKATDMPAGALPAQINVLKRIAKENDEPDIAEAAELLSQNPPEGDDGTND